MSSNLEPLIPTRPPTRTMLVVLSGFTVALCWWIGIAGVVNSGGGAHVFLTVPVLVTIGTLLAARRRGRQRAKHVSQSHGHKARGALSEKRRSLVVLCGFTAALCWWIGIVGVVNSGGGAHVFLTVPVLATIGTLLAARYKGRLAA